MTALTFDFDNLGANHFGVVLYLMTLRPAFVNSTFELGTTILGVNISRMILLPWDKG